ncbi:hypothetical protein PALA50_06151 (plasmid) [Pseudomonas aeruginosa]|nr:hypothetical protein PALA50_06151 [Pseudomonas aeruginosa]
MVVRAELFEARPRAVVEHQRQALLIHDLTRTEPLAECGVVEERGRRPSCCPLAQDGWCFVVTHDKGVVVGQDKGVHRVTESLGGQCPYRRVVVGQLPLTGMLRRLGQEIELGAGRFGCAVYPHRETSALHLRSQAVSSAECIGFRQNFPGQHAQIALKFSCGDFRECRLEVLDGFQGGWCAKNGQAVEVAEGFRRLHYVEQVNALFGGGREELVQLGVAELILPLVLLGCDTWRHGVRVEVDGLTGKSRDVLGAQREVVHRPRVLQPTERGRAEQPGAQVGQALLTQCVACVAAGTRGRVIGYALNQVGQTLRRDVMALG